MKNLKLILFPFFLLGLSTSYGQNDGFEKLFNGKNLDNWTTWYREDGMDKNLFKVEDGMIHAYADQVHNSEQTYAGIVTKKTYSNYILTLEYKWGEKKFKPRHDFVRDAGIMFHIHGAPLIWPNSVECQIQEGDTGDLWIIGTKATSKVSNVIRNYSPTGEEITRGTPEKRFDRFHRGYSWELPDWNKVEIEVRGDYAKFTVNGKVVNEAIDMMYWDEAANVYKPLTEGKILLQAEGAEIYYRNVLIKELDSE